MKKQQPENQALQLHNLIQTGEGVGRPEAVRIFGKDIQIIYGSEEFGMESLGLAHYDSNIINIRNGQTSIGERNTVLHECIHIVEHTLGLDLDERQVTVLTNGLIGVFEDNPDFAKYVIGLK